MLLELNAVSKSHSAGATQTNVLRDITLTVERGDYLAIEGPSGCGKSTLLSILGLLDVPSRGSYSLKGRLVGTLSRAARARLRNKEIGFIFQNFNLIGELTVTENVELPLVYRGISSAERKKQVSSVIERVGISYCSGRYPEALSGGEQQRVAVARAVIGSPSVLLADEPTGNLDRAHGEEVMDLISDLHRGGATVIMVTHDPRFAKRASRSLQLLDGTLMNHSSEDAVEPA